MGAFWTLTGGVTTTTAVVKVRADGTDVALKYGTSSAVTSTAAATPIVAGMASFSLAGLTADTTYYYVPVVDSVDDTGRRGTFHTFPNGAATFTFAFSACAGGETTFPVAATDPQGTPTAHSNHMAFDAIRALHPLFFMHIGDLHYEDNTSTDVAEWRRVYDRAMANSRQRALYREVPLLYMFDNHDFYFVGPLGVAGGNNRYAVRTVYRERIPAYTLPTADPSAGGAIYQTFVCGRVRFIVTDTISERSDWSAVDNASKTMLGATQKTWFKAAITAATEPVICWVMPAAPWIGGVPSDVAYDRWPVFTTERNELATYITDSGKAARMFVVSADAHMMAYDDGTNAPAAIKVMQAAAIDRGGNLLGGPYSSGTPTFLRGSFGVVTVTDTGGATIDIAFSGRRVVTQDSQATTQLVSGSFTVTV